MALMFRCDFSEYRPWSGATDTYDKIERAGRLDDLEDYLENIFFNYIPTDTDINDVLWFEGDTVLEALGLSDEDEDDWDEEEEDEEEE